MDEENRLAIYYAGYSSCRWQPGAPTVRSLPAHSMNTCYARLGPLHGHTLQPHPANPVEVLVRWARSGKTLCWAFPCSGAS